MITAKVVRFIALIVWLTGEFVLGGCTSVPRAPLSAYPKVYGESPETIRTLGTDHQFSDLTVGSVAQRLRGLSAADAFTILALSGGGANGAFGAGALVGLARSGTRPRFSVVTGVSALHACVSYGYECARTGRLWVSAQHAFTNSGTRDGTVGSRNIPCPADDDLIRGFALR